MTLLILNGNILCCGCQNDTGIRSAATNLFDESEVYCGPCSLELIEEIDDGPPTLRMTDPYPFPFMGMTPRLSSIGESVYVGREPKIDLMPDSGVRQIPGAFDAMADALEDILRDEARHER